MKNKPVITSLILCGGSGTRLWPLSRVNYPKQFLKLNGSISLLQATYLRQKRLSGNSAVYFVTGKSSKYTVMNQILEVDQSFNPDNVIIEPESKNTAPAIIHGMRTLIGSGLKNDAPVIVTPADHHIEDESAYIKTIVDLVTQTAKHIVTIGIRPTGPETGYGYIKKDEGDNGRHVLQFKEKPDLETAKQYVEEGYLWNSGVYAFTVDSLQNELTPHASHFLHYLTADVKTATFSALPSISFDEAVAEHAQDMLVFEGNFGWNDLGSFDSLDVLQPRGAFARHVGINSDNISIHNTRGKLVTTIGVSDLIIAENNDSILICKKGDSEKVKELVVELRRRNYSEIEDNIIVHRPWGSYEVLIDSPTYKVKKIRVLPGARLSLQSHSLRSEHWVVVRGIAEAVRDDEVLMLHENQSTFIPCGTKHQLANPGREMLEIIEVQTGSYLGEDDIVRYEDMYERMTV